MLIKAPGEGISICRSKDPQEELIERTYGYVIASRRCQRKIRCIEVVEDLKSSPHKAVSFVVEITKLPGMARAKNARSATRLQLCEVSRKKQGRGRQSGR